MAVQYCFVRNQWNIISAIQDRNCWSNLTQPGYDRPWCRFVVSESDVLVYGIAATEPFPSRLIEMKDCTYRVTELPGPAISGDKALRDTFDVRMENERFNSIHITYKNHRPFGEASGPYEAVVYEDFFDQLLDEMIFIVHSGLKVNRSVSDTVYWDELLSILKRDYGKDPAKHALIAELAEIIIQPIERIAAGPKIVLKRIRDQERIQTVREIDKHCLVDLARRPGRSLPEKAGRRQRILSIKRHESTDVLENQVFLHCCKLLLHSSKRYLSAHHHIESSRRKNLVQALYRCCKRLLNATSFRGVSHLRNPCRYPNYALLQNIYYAKVWKAYTQLLRNEQLRDLLWRWSRRLWSDYLALFLADTILSWSQLIKPPVLVQVGEKVVQANALPHYGKWLLTDVMPGPFVLGTDSQSAGTLYAIDGSSSNFLGTDALCLSALNADYLLVWLSPEGGKVLPVYAHWTVDHGDQSITGQEFNEMSADLLTEIETFNSGNSYWHCIGAWVLIGPQFISQRQIFGRRAFNQLCCWQSAPSTDPLSWHRLEADRFAPLVNLVGIREHVSRD